MKLVAATQEDLPRLVASGRFRADLYHRLAVVLLRLPSLCERQEDILLLAQHFLRQYATAHGLAPKRLTAAAETWLRDYAWPGNVRELSHLMERVILLSPDAVLDAPTLAQLCLPLQGAPVHMESDAAADSSVHLDEPAQLRQALYQTGGNVARAVQYLQVAGAQAAQRSAHKEALQHFTRGLELLPTLPDTPARTQQELDLQIALGPVLIATKGRAAPEVEQTYARARVLCTQVGETPQLYPALRGLCLFYQARVALPTARELGEQLVQLAQRTATATALLEAHSALGKILFFLGDYATTRMHLEQGIALTDPTAQRAQALRYEAMPGVTCFSMTALTLWCLGYPAQAAQRSQEALALAQALDHPYSLAMAQNWAAYLHHCCREVPAVQAQADALLTLASAQRFPLWVGFAACWRGWALAAQGQGEAGLAQLRQGMAAVLATGQELSLPSCLVLLAEAAGHVGQVEEGLRLLAEALTALEASGRGDLLTEVYRLQGEFLLRRAVPDAIQAEACFQQALAIARRQQVRSWELRAALSLSRLWQQQGKGDTARQLLAEVYGWFTEGFDTPDLQEAAALLTVLGQQCSF